MYQKKNSDYNHIVFIIYAKCKKEKTISYSVADTFNVI